MNPTLYIKRAKGKGRGVFSKAVLLKGTLVEACPLIVLPGADYNLVTATQLINYSFFFNQEKEELAIVLGFGSLYNHSIQPNACPLLDLEKRVMLFYANRDIRAGEEICINYNGGSEKDTLKWFSDRNLKYLS